MKRRISEAMTGLTKTKTKKNPCRCHKCDNNILHKVIQASALQKMTQFANNRAFLAVIMQDLGSSLSTMCVTDFTLTKTSGAIVVSGNMGITHLCACPWIGPWALWARRSCRTPRRGAGGPSRPGCGGSDRWRVWWHRGPSWGWWPGSPPGCGCGLIRSRARSCWRRPHRHRAPWRPPARWLKLPSSDRPVSWDGYNSSRWWWWRIVYVEEKKKLVEVLVKIWFRDQAVPELIPLSSYQSQYLHWCENTCSIWRRRISKAHNAVGPGGGFDSLYLCPTQ